MRINEDYIDTLSDDELIDNHLESDKATHEFQYIICFGLESENNNYVTRLEKMMSSFPYINKTAKLEFTQAFRGVSTSMRIRNGETDVDVESIFKINFIPLGIDADFNGNTRNACSFMLWLHNLPKEQIHKILIISSDSVKNGEDYMLSDFMALIDFVEYRSEKFNSSERNPTRVSFNDFIDVVAYISKQDIDDVVPYIFRRLDIMDVYVRADNRNRRETRIHDELRQIVESGDALKKYTAHLSVLQSKYKDIVKMRYAEYDKVIDECLWSVPYTEREYDDSCPKRLSMSMSSIGVKKNTDLCKSYIEMAVFCNIRNHIVTMMVAITKDMKTFLKFLKDIIPDVSDDELLAIKKEIQKLR